MAKLQKSQVVLRFVLGKGNVKARARYQNTARAILGPIAYNMAEDNYQTMRETLEQRVEMDVRSELVHLARLFRRHIIGAAGTKTSPTGELDTNAKGVGAPTQSIAGSLPAWAPRGAQYLARKHRATGGIKWWDNRGWRAIRDARSTSKRMIAPPKETGVMFEMARADEWESIFGPIRVTFRKSHKLTPDQVLGQLSTGKTAAQVQVGTLRVQALGRITPQMLPGYTSGEVRGTTTRNSALLSMVAGSDRALAVRLGGRGPYRPTLEPFLGFFLTRALPHAVNERIRKGTLGSIVRNA